MVTQRKSGLAHVEVASGSLTRVSLATLCDLSTLAPLTKFASCPLERPIHQLPLIPADVLKKHRVHGPLDTRRMFDIDGIDCLQINFCGRSMTSGIRGIMAQQQETQGVMR